MANRIVKGIAECGQQFTPQPLLLAIRLGLDNIGLLQKGLALGSGFGGELDGQSLAECSLQRLFKAICSCSGGAKAPCVDKNASTSVAAQAGLGPESRSSTVRVIRSTNQLRRCRPTTQSVLPATNTVPSPGPAPRSWLAIMPAP